MERFIYSKCFIIVITNKKVVMELKKMNNIKSYGTKPLFLALGMLIKKKGFIAVEKMVYFERGL